MGLRRRAGRAASGQQTAEYALLIGLATLAAVSMQLLVRQAIQRGLQGVSDTALGAPPPYNVAKSSLVSQDVNVTQTTSRQGTADFHRTDTANQIVTGHSVVHDETIHIIPDLEP